MSEIFDSNELAALDAIIAASLSGRQIEEVPDEELLARLEASPALSAEADQILKSIGCAPFATMTDGNPKATGRAADKPAGMYRLGSDSNLSPSLKAEIDKKREEIRKRLKAARYK